MGEISEMILDGDLCQICGMYIEGGDGFPVTCSDCEGEPVNTKKTYVTFGKDHKHKINGQLIDWHCVAVIKCNNALHGRRLAFEFFKTKFCIERHEHDFDSNMKYFKRGFIEVN